MSYNAGFPRLGGANQFQCGSTKHIFPILSWSVNPVYNLDLLVPHKHPGDCYAHLLDPGVSQVPWEEKENVISFFGSGSGNNECDPNKRDSQRQRFCGFVKDRKDEWEAALNVTVVIGSKFMATRDQAKSKFLILQDGAVAAFRSSWYFATGSVIFATGVHVDVRTAMLIPYVHYIPFKVDYSDFFEQLAMMRYDDEYARWIGENARAVAKLISKNPNGEFDNGFAFDKYYWTRMLHIYTKTFSFIEEPGDGSVGNFTNDRGCGTFIENNCIKESKYACEGLLQDGYPGSPSSEALKNTSFVPKLYY